MTLQIHAVSEIDSSDLQSLVVDNLSALLGEGARLVENMPQIDGCCLATSNRHDGPVLLSFDAVDPQRALLTGLARVDQLGSEIAKLVHAGLPSTNRVTGAGSRGTSRADNLRRTMPR